MIDVETQTLFLSRQSTCLYEKLPSEYYSKNISSVNCNWRL